MGSVPSQDLPKIYKKYKYFTLVSYYEGMPKVLIEAMASGCICLCSRGDGIEEIIEDGYNGFLSNGFNSNDIFKLFKRVMSTHKSKISINAMKDAKKKYSLESILVFEKNLYQNFANEKQYNR